MNIVKLEGQYQLCCWIQMRSCQASAFQIDCRNKLSGWNELSEQNKFEVQRELLNQETKYRRLQGKLSFAKQTKQF